VIIRAAYVARVCPRDDRDAVLKLAIPGAEFADRAGTLAMARGRGYAALLACDAGRQAMLLEALGPSMSELALPAEAIGRLCRALLEAWQVPRPPGAAAPPGWAPEEKAEQLARTIAELWERLGRPCSERVVRRALEFAGGARTDPFKLFIGYLTGGGIMIGGGGVELLLGVPDQGKSRGRRPAAVRRPHERLLVSPALPAVPDPKISRSMSGARPGELRRGGPLRWPLAGGRRAGGNYWRPAAGWVQASSMTWPSRRHFNAAVFLAANSASSSGLSA
jgi:Aminoglycoside/hydroxyurea antibiotic resistance kinase